MKKLTIVSTALLALALVGTPLLAQTNTNKTAFAEAVATAKQTVADAAKGVKQAAINTTEFVETNQPIHEAVLGILKGVKNAGGEIYDASKTAISKSVDFTMEQAPLVVKEFLHWSLAERVVWIAIWGTVAGFILFAGHVCNRQSKSEKVPDHDRCETDKGDYTGFKWAFRTIGLLILVISLGINGMVIAKIVVAPRVFLIEYVVDQVQAARHPGQ